MIWIFLSIAAILFFLIVVAFPKQTFLVIGVIVAALALYIYNLHTSNQRIEENKIARQNAVTVSLANDLSTCQDNKLLIEISNSSTHAVIHTEWDISIHVEGYSFNILDRLPFIKMNGSSDKIIKPGENFNVCINNKFGDALKNIQIKGYAPNLEEFIHFLKSANDIATFGDDADIFSATINKNSSTYDAITADQWMNKIIYSVSYKSVTFEKQ